MKDKFTEWLQQQLKTAGFNPGSVDGVYGRRTARALEQFQRAYGLTVTSQADAATVARLRLVTSTGVAAPVQDLYTRYPWMALALRKKGLRENIDNAELRTFLKSDGKTLGDPAKLPWCGDFVETCIALTLPREPLPTNPYLARNWQKFGQASEPGFGAVLVFWRTSKTKSTNGHVGFYVGEDADNFYVLGGNQTNSVSIAKLDKKRLLSARVPTTVSDFVLYKVKMNDDGPVSTNEA